jgi:two-component system, NarL family, sensor kinase
MTLFASRTKLLLVATWFTFCAQSIAEGAAAQKNVLLLYGSRSDMPANIVVDGTIRLELKREFDVNLDIYSEYFDELRFPRQDYSAAVNWLRDKYAGTAFDVVVAVGVDALRFMHTYRDDLFKGAKFVFWGRREGLRHWTSKAPLAAALAPEMNRQVRAIVDFIAQLQPDLQQLIVVSGASTADRNWEAAARTVLGAYEKRFTISHLAAQTLERVQDRLARVQGRSAVLFLTMNEDAAGRRLFKGEALTKVVQAAAAPVYSTSDLHVDTGITGGVLISQEIMSKDAAKLVAWLLRNERVETDLHEVVLVPTVNWRQLRRWRIPTSRIPAGAVVIEKDPSMWEHYKWRIGVVVALCAIEAMLIVALLIQGANRRRAERSLRESKRLLQSTIDALDAQVALLDGDGTVVALNQAWLHFREGNCDSEAGTALGRRYLDVCSGSEYPEVLSSAVRDLLSGAREYFGCVYPCTQGREKLWFQVRMNRFQTDGTLWVVMQHENVTDIKLAHASQQRLTGLLLRAQDDERKRIARDLHDVTAQNLATIRAQFMRVRRFSPELHRKAQESVEEGLRLSDEVIRELRTLSYVLHPPLLDESGLVPALQWFIRGFIERSGIQVDLLVHGEVRRLPTDAEIALFRVAQESMANIHRHSGSATATICVTQDPGGAVLQIIDGGRGFSKHADPGHSRRVLPGVGIMGMQERLRQLGGQLEIESGTQGTTVTARVPSKECYAAYSDR